jgi:hypothetical protein
MLAGTLTPQARRTQQGLLLRWLLAPLLRARLRKQHNSLTAKTRSDRDGGEPLASAVPGISENAQREERRE